MNPAPSFGTSASLYNGASRRTYGRGIGAMCGLLLREGDALALRVLCAGYTATVKGGTNGIKDTAGNALATDKVWSFTVVPPLPQDSFYAQHVRRLGCRGWSAGRGRFSAGRRRTSL